MKLTLFVFFGAVVVAGLVFGVLIAPNFIPSGGSEDDWADYTSADALVNDSDRIIIARYLDESLHVKPEISAATGEEHGSVSHLFRRFEVVESLKGSATIGETTFVAFTTGYTTKLDNGESEFTAFEVVALVPRQEYALFLYGVPRKEGYPAQYGETLWATTGEPGIASVDQSGGLSFKSSERYKNEQGLGVDTGAPFVLSKDQIRSIMSTSQ